ncbi:hypothetical protein ACM64Y_12970 [Novispirillum sp. DQ9]|uniref:hypothetical protein n=1 Tax=Novispirillum sp. DQ9 TaxID=3398612 RepID=UPI003C7A8BDD
MSFSTSISDRPRSTPTRTASTRRGSGGARARRYLLRLGVLAAGVLAATAALVWTVDPYDALGRNRVGIYAESERQAKPVMMRAVAPDTVLIGTSKPAYIDPATVGPRAFNAAFAAAMPEEIVNFLRSHVAPGTRVIVALDSFMMNAQAYPLSPDTFSETPSRFATLSYLFALRPAVAAVEAVASRALGKPPLLTSRGQRDPAERMARHDAMTTADYGPWLEYLRTHQYADFRYSAERVEALRALKEVARERDLTLHVFVDPLSTPVREMIATLPAAEDVARFHRDVMAALPGTVDMTALPEFADPDLYFRFDPFHYLPETGARILKEVLSRPPVHAADPPAPFGVVRDDDYPRAASGLTLKHATHSPQDSTREAAQ